MGLTGPTTNSGDSTPPQPSRALVALAVLLGLEGIALVVLTALLVIEIIGAPSSTIVNSLALAVFAAVFAVLLLAVARGALRAAKWIRPAALTWNLVQGLVGVYAFQGAGASPALGTALVVPALLVIILLFTRSVIAATRRN